MNDEAERGTPEFHINKLKFLKKWLDKNPKNTQLVADEAAALGWAIELLGQAK